jgi:cytoskeletal protein CcmA (bactofilin family)
LYPKLIFLGLRIDWKLFSTGKLVIGPAGIITGDIQCKNADIEGKFEGTIRVAEILNVKAQAVIKGEVTVGKLSNLVLILVRLV